jgi:hypothetical protein
MDIIPAGGAMLRTVAGSHARRWLRVAAVATLLTGGHVAASIQSPTAAVAGRVRARAAAMNATGTAPTESFAVSASGAAGAVYNLRVVSDASPDLTDLGSLVSSITAGWPTDREKVWALYYWSHILKRQTVPMLSTGSSRPTQSEISPTTASPTAATSAASIRRSRSHRFAGTSSGTSAITRCHRSNTTASFP